MHTLHYQVQKKENLDTSPEIKEWTGREEVIWANKYLDYRGGPSTCRKLGEEYS